MYAERKGAPCFPNYKSRATVASWEIEISIISPLLQFHIMEALFQASTDEKSGVPSFTQCPLVRCVNTGLNGTHSYLPRRVKTRRLKATMLTQYTAYRTEVSHREMGCYSHHKVQNCGIEILPRGRGRP